MSGFTQRRCCKCSIEDAPLEDFGYVSDERNRLGEIVMPKPQHRVTIQLKYLPNKEAFTQKLARAGWRVRDFQGRPAMERTICRPCMNSAEFVERDAKRIREQHLRVEAEQRGETNIYALYNEDYV